MHPPFSLYLDPKKFPHRVLSQNLKNPQFFDLEKSEWFKISLPTGFSDKSEWFEGTKDFIERARSEIGDLHEFFLGVIQEMFDGEYSCFFQAIGGSNGKSDFGGTHTEFCLQIILANFRTMHGDNSGHEGSFPCGY